MSKKLWWSSDISAIKNCFVCGGVLANKRVPEDKKTRLVCTKCSHIFYINPKPVAGLIPITADGRIVLLRRDIEPGRGRWSFPAGFQEWGEMVEDAAMREAREEICVRTRVTGLVGVYSYPNSGILTTVYAGRVLKGQKPRAGHEASEVKLYTPDEIPWKDLAFLSTVQALRDYLGTLKK